MYTVNLLLRVSSGLIFVLLIHQLFFSKGGIKRHQLVGKIAIAVGALIFILVTIRGFNQEKFSITYAVHLAAGFPFFYMIFRTGYLGYKTRNNKEYANKHRRAARITFALLILTIIVGIISKISH